MLSTDLAHHGQCWRITGGAVPSERSEDRRGTGREIVDTDPRLVGESSRRGLPGIEAWLLTGEGRLGLAPPEAE